MSRKSLNNQSDIATENTNTTGQFTSILDFDPDRGTMLKFLNSVRRGQDQGFPFFAILHDSSDTNLPNDTRIILQVTRAGDATPTRVSVEQDNIGAWNDLTLQEQRNRDNIDAVKVELLDDIVNVRHIDTLGIYIDSSVQIDWTNSELYIPPAAVREVPWEA